MVSARIPASVWILGFVSLLMDVSSELIHCLLPAFMVSSLGASGLLVGLVEGIAESTALLVKVFSGTLSDYLGKRKWLAVIGYGLGAISKPGFAMATSIQWVLAARFTDRIGKGIRGAPRDALVADLTPPSIRGAAFGLRQALDSVGAFLGPLLALALMVAYRGDFRSVFRIAIIPAALSVILLVVGVREPASDRTGAATRPPLDWRVLRRLPRSYWRIAVIGGFFAFARFSEAFLILRGQQSGLPNALAPAVFVLMNMLYAIAAYPAGRLADQLDRKALLAAGLLALAAANLILACAVGLPTLAVGVALWGLHLGLTQGVLAALVADATTAELRGTAFGFFNLLSGIALLAASILAGLLWDLFGAPSTFFAGAFFALGALALLARAGGIAR